MNDVLKRITECLESKGMKAPKMLEELDITSSTYYTWRQKNTSPDSESLVKIAEYLGTTTDYLLTGKSELTCSDPEIAEFINVLKENVGLRVL